MIDPSEFQKRFVAWMQAVARISEGEIVPIDGKTLRRSHDFASNKVAIHMVSAWANGSRLAPGQVKTEGKSNEVTAIPELLGALDIHGCIVTIDAMGCQKKIAAQIIEQEADYVLGLKGSQGLLLDAVEETFSSATSEELNGSDFDVHQTEEDGHGRHEVRTYFISTLLDRLPNPEDWEGLQTLGVAISEVTTKGKTTMDCRYYIASIENDAQLFAHAVRSHWGIESAPQAHGKDARDELRLCV